MAFQCGDPGIRLVETRAVSTTYPADIAFEERELLARHIEALRPGNRWVRHGPCETFYPFNKVAVGQNRDGVPDGEFRILQDGRLVETQTYRAGQLLE